MANFTPMLNQLKAERAKLAAQLKQVDTAIAVLSANPTAAPRQPMSEEAKKKISEGLKKAQAAKAQGQPASAAPAPAPAPTAPAPKPEPKATAKAASKPAPAAPAKA